MWILGRRCLPAITTLIAVSTGSPALAQSGATTDPGTAHEVLEEVHVLGTRITRRDYLSPSPVYTVTRESLDLQGLPTLESVLNRLPQFSPSLSRYSTWGAAGDGRATLNLRGLGTNRNLVLLDGNRLGASGTGGVIDLNTIPAAMVSAVAAEQSSP